MHTSSSFILCFALTLTVVAMLSVWFVFFTLSATGVYTPLPWLDKELSIGLALAAPLTFVGVMKVLDWQLGFELILSPLLRLFVITVLSLPFAAGLAWLGCGYAGLLQYIPALNPPFAFAGEAVDITLSIFMLGCAVFLIVMPILTVRVMRQQRNWKQQKTGA